MMTTRSYAIFMAGYLAVANLATAQDAGPEPQAPGLPPIKDAEGDKPAGLPVRPLANNLFYLPTRDEPATPADWGYPYFKVDMTSQDGTRLHGWWIYSKIKPAKGTVVFSHGNAGSMGHHLGFVTWLARAGYDVLMYDYRGYGKSGGKIDRLGMVQDTRAALTFAGKESKRLNRPVISYGHSLGGAKSVAAIAEGKTPNLAAVITDASFASYRDMARIVGGRLAADLVSDEHAPIDHIKKISPLPLLVIHGKKDPVVPFSQGERLFDAAKKPKTMFKVDEGMHGDNLWRDNGAYRKLMLGWLDDNL